MNALRITIAPRSLAFEIGGGRYTVPVGVAGLAAGIGGDPPAPEDLSNAIGLVLDHLEDVERELPMAAFAEGLEVVGEAASVVADVEVGGSASLPFVLGREAAEDVFRTLATEHAADRARNPGLPAEWLHDVLGACCALVAVMRHFRATEVLVHGEVAQ